MRAKREFVTCLLAALAAALWVCSCASPRGEAPCDGSGRSSSDRQRELSAAEVIAWARLDDRLGHRLRELEYGKADGRTLLTEYVMVLNGEELVTFAQAHGYRSFRGPVAVRKRVTALEVDVEITGADGATLVITLFADGTRQGVG